MNANTRVFFELNSFAHKSKVGDFFIMFFGSYIAYPLAVAFPVYLLLLRTPLQGMLVVCAGALSAGVLSRFGFGSLIRFFRPVPRPFMAHPITPLIQLKSPSFPSGHALFFFALSQFVFFFNPFVGAVFFLITFGIAFARVIAGVHYPADMVAGFFIGVASAYLVYYLVPWIALLFS